METRVQASSVWNVASSVEFIDWLWMLFLPPRGLEGYNLGRRLIIHLLVSERVQIIWLELLGDL